MDPVLGKSCAFLQSKTKTHPELPRAHSRGCGHHWDSGPGAEEQLPAHLQQCQVPPAAAALVPLTLCKKPEGYSKLQVPRVWKTANPHPNLGALSSSFHGNSPEKILISGVFQRSMNAFSAIFVFNNSSIDWKLRGIFPHVLTHCLHPLGCRDGSCGADSSEHLILQERRAKAFPWMKIGKGNSRSWRCCQGEMQQHPWAQRAGNTKTCLNHEPKTPVSRLALWTSACAACNDFIRRRLAIGLGGWIPSNIPWLHPLPKPHYLQSCSELIPPLRSFPRHRLPPQGLFLCQKNSAQP